MGPKKVLKFEVKYNYKVVLQVLVSSCGLPLQIKLTFLTYYRTTLNPFVNSAGPTKCYEHLITFCSRNKKSYLYRVPYFSNTTFTWWIGDIYVADKAKLRSWELFRIKLYSEIFCIIFPNKRNALRVITRSVRFERRERERESKTQGGFF